MPMYVYECPAGHRFEQFRSLLQAVSTSFCQEHQQVANQIITAPLFVKASPTVCYDSPIDGRHITSWDARREDLKRSGCREYDPEMKKDHDRRLKESEAQLDATVDASVEEAIEKMPTAQRGKLMSELTDQGVQADVIRTTPHA